MRFGSVDMGSKEGTKLHRGLSTSFGPSSLLECRAALCGAGGKSGVVEVDDETELAREKFEKLMEVNAGAVELAELVRGEIREQLDGAVEIELQLAFLPSMRKLLAEMQSSSDDMSLSACTFEARRGIRGTEGDDVLLELVRGGVVDASMSSADEERRDDRTAESCARSSTPEDRSACNPLSALMVRLVIRPILNAFSSAA